MISVFGLFWFCFALFVFAVFGSLLPRLFRKFLSLTEDACIHSQRLHTIIISIDMRHAHVFTPFCMLGNFSATKQTTLIFFAYFLVIHYIGAQFDA